MAPCNFPAPQLKPSTRSKNKDAHPGQPVLDAKQARRSRQEMEEVRAQQAREQEEEKIRLEKNLKAAAQIEDELLQEDVQRRTSNHQSKGIAPFKPLLVKEVPPTSGESLHYMKSIPVEIRKSVSNLENEEGLEGSQDEYHPPECEDPGESDSNGESEAPDDTLAEEPTTKKPGVRKGKKPKPGQKDVVAVREAIAEKGTKLKRKADDNEK